MARGTANYRHSEICVTINNSENQAPDFKVLSAYHQAPNLENVGQMLQNCAPFWKQNLGIFLNPCSTGYL